ncbi:hypothetical protein CQW23_33340 [Capsicum baccatum]|uniref:Uncharacterized protein n=1 Tax=Capsicum baccatum TaxID=33114 RepID=A0A2G2V258_CAPBA|nr:hypothetical protein CQW23_33340 [Capsicum baccatum]
MERTRLLANSGKVSSQNLVGYFKDECTNLLWRRAAGWLDWMGRDEPERQKAESQWIVAAWPRCHLQYPVTYLSCLQRILPAARWKLYFKAAAATLPPRRLSQRHVPLGAEAPTAVGFPLSVPVLSWLFDARGRPPKEPFPVRPPAGMWRPALAAGSGRAVHRQSMASGLGPACPALRANRFPKLTVHPASPVLLTKNGLLRALDSVAQLNEAVAPSYLFKV